jgi:hypothetical protein
MFHLKLIYRIFFITIAMLVIVEGYSQPDFIESYPDSIINKRLTSVIIGQSTSYLATVSFLSFIWYSDHERVPFHFYNDAKGYLQVDKAGHAYGAYRESYATYYALRWAGLDKKKALIFGAPMGLILQTPIEIFDGMYEGWGFSWSDMVANTFGSALFTTQEMLFDDQLVLMKFSYSPSIYPKYHYILGETQLERFFYDYNGHTYWFSANIKKITGIRAIPGWLNFAVGYSANGMIKEFENPVTYRGEPFPHLKRYRQWLFSFDIDLSRVHTNKKWLRSIFRTVNLIKIPFPAVEVNRVDRIRFWPVYF